MRVITAVYLHVRAELRDEWLCGGDVDGVVEEAVPLEQAGRSLVHWWHLKNYREAMEGSASGPSGDLAHGLEERTCGEDVNFFERELERMGWGAAEGVLSGGSEDGEGQLEDGDHLGEEFKEWTRGPLVEKDPKQSLSYV